MKKSLPSVTIACPFPECPRRVGPYFSQEYAQRAMETHIRMRHNVVRRARSYVDGTEGWDRA
jgi:hypothetical protein